MIAGATVVVEPEGEQTCNGGEPHHVPGGTHPQMTNNRGTAVSVTKRA